MLNIIENNKLALVNQIEVKEHFCSIFTHFSTKNQNHF